MKIKLSAIFCAITASLVSNVHSAVVSNLLVDASFEALVGDEPNTDTSPWFTVGEDGSFKAQVSTDYAVTGLQSVKVANNDSVSIIQNTGIQLDTNKTYGAVAWISTRDPGGIHTDAPGLTISFFTSPTIDGTYTYRAGFFFDQKNNTPDIWERYSGSLAGSHSNFEGHHGEYIQIRFIKVDNGTSHWLYMDDLEFGEFTPDVIPPPVAPENLLIGWYGADSGFDYAAAGIGGAVNTNDIHVVSTSAGSSDGTYGTIGGVGTGTVMSATAYEVRVGGDTNSPNLTLGFSITNNTAGTLQLDSVNFDYGRFFAAGPSDIALLYDGGDLAGVTNDTVINTALDTPATGKYGDYNDYDWSLAGLADSTLAPGESAKFKLVSSNTGGDQSSGAFDNIGIFGGVPAAVYSTWAATWGVPLGAEGDDYDNDGLINLHEYGLGGNPTNGFVDGNIPALTKVGGDMHYVHAQRTDDLSLTYYLELAADLNFGAWTNDGYTVSATNVTGGLFDYVTNTIPIDINHKFIRLIIE